MKRNNILLVRLTVILQWNAEVLSTDFGREKHLYHCRELGNIRMEVIISQLLT